MTYRKWLAVLVIAVVLLAIGQYFFLPDWYRESGIKVSGWLMMLSIGVAIALSIFLISWSIKKFSAGKGKRIGAYIGGYGMYPFALFLGFIVGGNFGGAIGENVLGEVGTVVGIGLGIFIVTIVACSVSAAIGYLIGGLAYRT